MSQRHVSFLETGRSRPRRDTILRLCAALDVPLRDQNALLLLAGLPANFEETPLGTGSTAPYAAALGRTLAAHAPYPGVIVNGWWDIVRLNDPGRQLLGDLDGENLAALLLRDGPLRTRLENSPAVARAVLGRLRRDARRAPFDARLAELCTLAEAECGPSAGDSVAICPTFRVGDAMIRTFSLVGELTTAHDITLDELRVELLYPADEASALALERIAPA